MNPNPGGGCEPACTGYLGGGSIAVGSACLNQPLTFTAGGVLG